MLKELTHLFRDLPQPESFSIDEAKQILVHLSLAGASVVRHYQEHDIAREDDLSHPLRILQVGAKGLLFRDYFNRLANNSGTGHPNRDSYAALARWNVPTAEVSWNGKTLCRIPGAFNDGSVRTYTGDPGERAFFEILKKCEAVELAVNKVLIEVIDNFSEVSSEEASDRINMASHLLATVHRLNLDFASMPPESALHPDHFLDVFRQFATHWETGDIPPSGAQDVEYLKRDLILGINFPDYFHHVQRMFPALLAEERDSLTKLAQYPSFASRIMEKLGITGDLSVASEAKIHAVLSENRPLASCYFLLQTNARVASSHLMLTKKYLFKPHHEREKSGVPDGKLVSHSAGTTGMVERLLERLMKARKDHELKYLGNRTDRKYLMKIAGIENEARVSQAEAAEIVKFR
ncbi:hypothetical protein [Streptomyces sp. NPDC096153]|uniref:hypothetical protein n=1 Tax=Streptomyces sp. NPDC096153 TaxID=3155548 RepID=UPI00332CC009